MKRALSSTILVIILITILLTTGCGTGGQEQEYISGAKRRSQKHQEFITNIASTIYTPPLMNSVKVKVNAEYDKNRFMDLYYPPGYNFDQKLPGVIVFNNFAGLHAKDMGRHIDWGALLAASGFIGITYEPIYPDHDFKALLANLGAEAETLGIDSNNLALICNCGSCPAGLHSFEKDFSESAEGLKTGVFLYGPMPWSDNYRENISILIVKTGKGTDLRTLNSIDKFAAKSMENGIKTDVIDYSEGYKYFDITEVAHQPWEYGVDRRYTQDCDVMKEIIEFIRKSTING